jgi:hypothetical protein
MMKLLMPMLLCTFGIQSSTVSQPVGVTVRLIYLNSGKAADGQQIVLYEGNPSLASTIRSTQTTGGDGSARFRVSNPFPKTVWVDDNNGRVRSCAWEDQIPLSAILSEGVTVGKDNRFGSWSRYDLSVRC